MSFYDQITSALGQTNLAPEIAASVKGLCDTMDVHASSLSQELAVREDVISELRTNLAEQGKQIEALNAALAVQSDALSAAHAESEQARSDLESARATFVQATHDAQDPDERIKQGMMRPEIVQAAGVRGGMSQEEIESRVDAALTANGE